ncbi:PIG-L family deacetylase [candidate division KSB3 bacterium]|uniref:PIG-L family deacetylase n=1 Tax=candidate division KSB3 bacterium TaxID=2044937 RepID=A0A9D5JTG7_9BACT|nr:PIG-L family deacetylase [candidate division KSB3 bacterium]MBD3323794.1 PIG-L family deacetylase [candidate division KSB3 bacterium]
MKILYIYPHPDDESFGPAHVMSKQRRQGHEVYLLTLTKGGATRQRFKYHYSIEEMGDVRYQEMLNVAKVLDLTEMTVLDLPDSGLKEMDPRDIEQVVKAQIERIQPQVVLTYAVHGISGFHDHLVSHAVVKRVFVELRETLPSLKRLAFVTITEESAQQSQYFHLNGSTPEEIDCIVEVDEIDIQRCYQALDCYVTFQETIEKSGIKKHIQTQAVFEIFQEQFNPPLTDLFAELL